MKYELAAMCLILALSFMAGEPRNTVEWVINCILAIVAVGLIVVGLIA